MNCTNQHEGCLPAAMAGSFDFGGDDGLQVYWWVEQEDFADRPMPVHIELTRKDDGEKHESDRTTFDVGLSRFTSWPWTHRIWRHGEDLEGLVEEAVSEALIATGAA